MIQPYIHSEINVINLSIIERISPFLVRVVYPVGENNDRLYSGKKFTYNNMEMIYYKSSDTTSYVYSTNPNFETFDSVIPINVSFSSIKDNEALTYSDILNRFANPEPVTISGIEMIAKPVFINDLNRKKLDRLKSKLTTALNVQTNGNVYTIGCIKKIDGEHKFELTSDENIIKFTLIYNDYGWSIKLDNNTSNHIITLNLYSGNYQGNGYLGINCKFTNNNQETYKVSHYVADSSDIILQNPVGTLSNLTPLSYKSTNSRDFGDDVTELNFCNFIKEITQNGIQTKLFRSSYIQNVSLNDYLDNGIYNSDNENVTDKPTDLTTPFLMEVKTLIKTASSYVISQTIITYVNSKEFKYVRYITNDGFSSWVSNNQSIFWRDAVNRVVNLPSTAVEGWICYVTTEKCLYKFDGTNWVKLYINVSENNDGLFTAEDYTEFVVNSALSKKVPNQNSYIHRLSDNVQTENNVLFLAPVEYIDPKIIKSNTITLGFSIENTQGGIGIGNDLDNDGIDNITIGRGIKKSLTNLHRGTIGIGNDLLTSADKQIVLGNMNLGLAENVFEIGVGETERANIFEVSIDGIAKCNGFKINDIPGYLLMSDGSMINMSDVGKSPAFRRDEYTFTFETENSFELPDSVHSLELPVFINQSPYFEEHVTFNELTKTVTILSDILYEGDIIKIYAISPDENAMTDPIFVVDDSKLVNGIFTIGIEHDKKSLLITANNAQINVVSNLPNQFKVDLDFAITNGKIQNSANATGNFNQSTTNIYQVISNGQVKIYKASGVTRIVGDFV